ncbi:MAG TPA: aminoglycoside phosphotransferase family protein [Acidimicrobiales bacterium]
MNWPDAEISIDAALVDHLVRSQHADLASEEIREVAVGFDNSIWRLGADLVVRLPRRTVAARLIANELKWLPDLSPRLPLRTPTPVRAGHADEIYPWPWAISRWIDGVAGNEALFDTNGGGAEILGLFLRSLHQTAPPDAPVNEFRSVALRRHVPSYSQRIERLGDAIDANAVSKILRRAIEAPAWLGDPQWIHGDLHPANTIYRDGRLVGVVDFGDLCAGDPATDLAGAFMSLPLSALPTFFRAYGPVDDATIARTRGWAVHFGLMFMMLGVRDEPTYAPIGARALDNARRFAGFESST